MATKANVTVASRSQLITESGFNNYDACLNTYVGCQFGCTYCYVRFFIKDENHEWGDFVRVRNFVEDKLPKELAKNTVKLRDGWQIVKTGKKVKDKDGSLIDETKKKRKYKSIAITDARLVIGTMTDPYQPVERKYRVTRKALEILTRPDVPHFQKVGLFTRSPIVLEDLDLITQLPNARVHFTVTPFPPKVLRAIEPMSPKTERRWDVVKKLKEAGLRVHCNISPIIPGLSEGFEEEFVEKLIELEVDEYFVDPMQPYKESFESFRKACQGLSGVKWAEIERIMTDRDEYLDWKADYYGRWDEIRQPLQSNAPDQMPIWCDHENHVWINMVTGKQMDSKHYGEEAKK